MASILASVSVVLGAEVSDFNAKMAAARKELRGLVKASEGLQSVGQSLSLAVTAPLALLGGAVIKVGGDFESAFNRVQAATQASGAGLLSLRDKAKDIALDPKLKFSATQAAAALENLAKNGLNTTQILGGAADATVNLATATGGQLATSADIATDVMNNFNLTATQLAASVDNITGTTIASKLDIDNYRQALGQAGGVAGQLGVKFSDFNTALAVTSSGFSSGSDAGTSFKTFLQRLVPQSKEAEGAMRQLGLKFFDAQGQMKPLREIAGELQRAFKGLSDEQRNGLGTKIFGSDSIRTALLLAKDGAEGFDKMAQSIGKVNAASQGAILSKGFAGAFEGLKSAAEGLGIAIADSGLLEFAAKIVRGLAEFAAGLAKTDPVILNTIVVLAGIAAAVGPVLVAIGTLGVALPAITAGFALLSAPVVIAVAALAALGVGIALLVGSSKDTTTEFRNQAASVRALTDSVNPLLTRYDELKGKTTLTKAEQEELRGIIEKVGKQIPTSITAFDSYGRALDINSGKARDFVKAQQEILAIKNRDALSEQRAEYARLTEQIKGAQNALKQFDAQGNVVKTVFDEGSGGFQKLTDGEISATQARLESLRAQRRGVGGLIDELKGIPPAIGAVNAAGPVIPPVQPGDVATTKDQTAALEKQLRALQKLNEGYDNMAIRSVLKPQETPEFKLNLSNLGGPPTTLAPIDNSAFIASLQAASSAGGIFTQSMADFNTRVGEILSAFPSQLFANLGSDIGNALGSGASIIEAAGKSILKSLADLGAQFGRYLTALGIANLSVPGLQGLGIAQIAGGVGLVAAAGLLGSFAGGGGGGGASASGGGTGISAPRSSFTPTTAPGGTAPGGPTTVTHNVVFNLQGNSLLAAIDIETDRLGRVVGRR